MPRKTQAFFQLTVREANGQQKMLTKDIPNGPIPDPGELVEATPDVTVRVRRRLWQHDGQILVDLGYLYVDPPDELALPTGWVVWNSASLGCCTDELRDAGWS